MPTKAYSGRDIIVEFDSAHCIHALTDSNGKPVLALARLALCRCGASANKPFCDGAHSRAAFHDAGIATTSASIAGHAGGPAVRPTAEPTSGLTDGPITLVPRPNGPITVSGPLCVRGADGALMANTTSSALCRCGASANKPFCDGAHTRIGFQA